MSSNSETVGILSAFEALAAATAKTSASRRLLCWQGDWPREPLCWHDFAGQNSCAEAGNARSSIKVGHHASAGVVLGRHYRNPILLDLQSLSASEALVDGGELVKVE